MNSRKSKLLLASVALCAWPMAAMAQQAVVTSSEVEVGVGGVTSDDFYFNEYTGIEDTDPYFFGNIQIQQRAAYDSDSSRYVEFLGRDLGLPSQSVYIEAGRQGSFSIYGESDAIPHLRFDDGQTPYSGAGSTNLTLPPGWVPGGDTAGLTNLGTSLQDIEVKTKRERAGAGFKVNLTPQWELSTSFRTEEKTGIETTAGLFGSTGGNMRAAILPKPIDYTTHDAEMSLGYSSDRLQAQVSYSLSVFDDAKDSLTWENPYNANAAWDPSQDYVNGGQGRMALEPDNSAHHISVSAGYMVSDQTRLAGNLSLGRMIQDDAFLPYTINSALTAADGVSALVPLPRDSLDGEVNTIRANLGVTTRLSQSIDLKAAYTYDDRDNQTPVDTYLTVANDSGASGIAPLGGDQGAIDSARARRNKPYSQQSHKVEAEAGYRVTADTKLSFGYDFEAINRDLSEVEDTQEHKVRAKVRSSLTPTASGSLSYEYATRTGSTYDSSLPFLASHDDAYLALPPPTIYEQNPYLRKFYMADRQRHLVKGGLTYFPNDQLVLGLNGSYNMSDYDAVIGLTESSYMSGTFDVNYMPSNAVNLSGFLTYEQLKFEQTGYERNTAIAPGDPLIATTFWDENSTEDAYTAGVDLTFAAIPNTLDVVFDYVYSHSVIGYDIVAGITTNGGLPVTPLPDLTSDLHSIGIRGDYHATDGITFRLGYRYEMFEVEDFALAGVDEVVAPAVFALGNGEPDYDAHLVAASMVIKF